MAGWNRQLTPTVLEKLDHEIEELRLLLLLYMLGKNPGTVEIVRSVNSVLSIASMPENVWMKEG